jgi:hypothetical protein
MQNEEPKAKKFHDFSLLGKKMIAHLLFKFGIITNICVILLERIVCENVRSRDFTVIIAGHLDIWLVGRENLCR